MVKRIQKINTFLVSCEALLISVSLMSMVTLAFTQIILRNFLDSAIAWANPFVQNMVMWIAFIGASIATKEKSHLKLDIISKFLPIKAKIFCELLVHLLSLVVLYYLSQASIEFIKLEMEYPSSHVGKFPGWYFLMIIPSGFVVITLRHLVLIVEDFYSIKNPEAYQESGGTH